MAQRSGFHHVYPDHSRRRFLGGAGVVATGLASTQLANAQTGCGGLSRADFETYLALFNANDPAFVRYYHDDVTLELGATEIRTPQGIIDFYSEVKSHIKETVELGHFISDETGIAAELPSEFACFNDWNDSFWQRDIKRGEVLRIISFVMYWVEDGKFKTIKSSRYRLVNDWQQEGFSL